MFGLKIYTVHVKPDAPETEQKPVFIKEGFNFGAFLFLALWALYRRLWVVAFLLIGVDSLLAQMLVAHMVNPPAFVVVSLGIRLLAGLLGNDWRRARLKRRGYITADIAAADSKLRAEQRYFERHLAAA